MKQINIKNKEQVEAAIGEAEGASRVNLVSHSMVLALARDGEQRLNDLGLSIKNRPGAQLKYSPAGPNARSYKYPQPATIVELVRRQAGWYLKQVERTQVYPLSREKIILGLTKEQKDVAVAALLNTFNIIKDEAE